MEAEGEGERKTEEEGRRCRGIVEVAEAERRCRRMIAAESIGGVKEEKLVNVEVLRKGDSCGNKREDVPVARKGNQERGGRNKSLQITLRSKPSGPFSHSQRFPTHLQVHCARISCPEPLDRCAGECRRLGGNGGEVVERGREGQIGIPGRGIEVIDDGGTGARRKGKRTLTPPSAPTLNRVHPAQK